MPCAAAPHADMLSTAAGVVTIRRAHTTLCKIEREANRLPVQSRWQAYQLLRHLGEALSTSTLAFLFCSSGVDIASRLSSRTLCVRPQLLDLLVKLVHFCSPLVP